MKLRRNFLKGFEKKLDRAKVGKGKKATSHAKRFVEQDSFRLAHMNKTVAKSKLKNASKLLAEIELSGQAKRAGGELF